MEATLPPRCFVLPASPPPPSYRSFTDNEFAWLGLSAMAGWGYTKEMDGTDGQQPRYTIIERNYVREIGIIEKQSSMWFQAKSCLNRLDSNVAFNQPRAAINLNDGFGGGTNITKNLLFNTCRETGACTLQSTIRLGGTAERHPPAPARAPVVLVCTCPPWPTQAQHGTMGSGPAASAADGAKRQKAKRPKGSCTDACAAVL